MTDRNTGGPAFPQYSFGNHGVYVDGGMTLRDYFASKELSKVDGVHICDEPSAYARLADHCYRMADAMLEARK